MTFEIKSGDLFDYTVNGTPDAIGHGVNCQGIMGAGFAKIIRNMYPSDMYTEYAYRCADFGPKLAGLHHHYRIPSAATPALYNMFTQIFPGKNGEYSLIQRSALSVRYHAEDLGYSTMFIPAIGCGIAGLELHNVEHILTKVWENSPIQFTMFVN